MEEEVSESVEGEAEERERGRGGGGGGGKRRAERHSQHIVLERMEIERVFGRRRKRYSTYIPKLILGSTL